MLTKVTLRLGILSC